MALRFDMLLSLDSPSSCRVRHLSGKGRRLSVMPNRLGSRCLGMKPLLGTAWHHVACRACPARLSAIIYVFSKLCTITLLGDLT